MQKKWEAQWKKMTIEQQFAFRGLVQHVLKEKLQARKADIDRRLHVLKPSPRSTDPIKVSRP
ncbi:MAG: hypothetical protein ABW175_13570 [Bradyrhizobium sp.]